MLYTLHGYVLRELLKVFAISAIVLTIVLSLGGLLEPLRHHGISAVQLFQLIVFFFPMMLTFSMPVAAMLATTLVYGRLSGDNELIACRASGIGLPSLVKPALLLGAAVMVSNLLLSNWLVPNCAKQAAEIVREDIQDIAFNKLKNDRQLSYGGWVITAEDVARSPVDPQLMRLVGAAMAKIENGVPQQMILCGDATLRFDKAANEVTILPRNVVVLEWQSSERPARFADQTLRWQIPPLVRDEVAFKSYADLRVLDAHPENYDRVKMVVDLARRRAARRLLYEDVKAALSARPAKPFRMKYTDGLVHGEATVEADVAVIVDKGLTLRLEGVGDRKVKVTLRSAGPDGRLSERDDVIYESSRADFIASSRGDEPDLKVDVKFPVEFTRRNLRMGVDDAPKASGSITEVLAAPAELAGRVASIPIAELEMDEYLTPEYRRQVFKLRQEIEAELHSRGSFSVAGLVLVMLGTALGVIFRSGHVLVGFFLAAVPGLATIILVLMGKQVATSSESLLQQFGVLLIWAGNFVVLLLTGFVYWRLMKR